MTLRVAIQMDPLASINPAGDSTLLLGLEAQKRGYEVWHYTPDKLTFHNGEIVAEASRVTLHANSKQHYTFGKSARLKLKDMDVILLRQDPPFDTTYIATTYLLEQLHPRPLVVNDPTSVRDNPEKWMVTRFPEFVPPTLVTADIKEIERFRKTHKDIVLKPFFGYAGRSVFRIKPDDSNFQALVEMIFSESKEPWVVQPFLKEVKTQERRIVMIDGKFSGIVGRIPPAGEIRSNFRVGGTPAKVKPTRRQLEVCEAIGPTLRQEGLLFAGVDMIGDYLTEINITSPTGLVPINRLSGKKLEAEFWDAVETYL